MLVSNTSQKIDAKIDNTVLNLSLINNKLMLGKLILLFGIL